MTTGTNFGFLLGMCTTMSKFGANFCVIGRRFENHVPISLVLRRSCCSESAYWLRAGVLLQSNRWAHRPDLLSVFVRLESVWLLAEGLLIVGTFHCYSSFAKFSFGRQCRQLQIPILRNQCTFFFFGRAEGGFLISERDSWSCFWRSYSTVTTGHGMSSCF